MSVVSIHLDRINKLLDQIIEQTPPYNSGVFQQLALRQGEGPDLLLELYLEILAFNGCQSVMIASVAAAAEILLKKNYVYRYVTWRQGHAAGKRDIEIFRVLYDELPAEQRHGWIRFYGSMRKWKTKHAYALANPPPPAILTDMAAAWISPKPQSTQFDDLFREVWHDLYCASGLKFLNYGDECTETATLQREKFHFFEYVGLKIIRKLRDARTWYQKYQEALKRLGELIAIDNPLNAQALNSVQQDSRRKAPKRPRHGDTIADLCRGINLALSNPAFRQYNTAFWDENTCRKKLSELNRIITSGTPLCQVHQERIEKAHTTCCFKAGKEREALWRGEYQEPSPIRDDSDIRALIKAHLDDCDDGTDLMPTEQQEKIVDIKFRILKLILTVCRERRSWKCPNELPLRQSYLEWLAGGFFEELWQRKDKKNPPQLLRGVRWHQVPMPSQIPTESRVTLISPYWGAKHLPMTYKPRHIRKKK